MGTRSVSTQASTGYFAALDGTEGKLLPFVSKISIAELSGKGQLITLNKSLRLVVRIHLELKILPSYARSKVKCSLNVL